MSHRQCFLFRTQQNINHLDTPSFLFFNLGPGGCNLADKEPYGNAIYCCVSPVFLPFTVLQVLGAEKCLPIVGESACLLIFIRTIWEQIASRLGRFVLLPTFWEMQVWICARSGNGRMPSALGWLGSPFMRLSFFLSVLFCLLGTNLHLWVIFQFSMRVHRRQRRWGVKQKISQNAL